MKHSRIVNELVKKYKADKNVLGIYIFGSLAKGTATSKSDIDMEIVFNKRQKRYELINKKINGVNIDLSMYEKKHFIKEFTNHPYLMYASLDYKIIYDPEGILKENLKRVKDYFKSYPKIKKFWKEKEKKWKEAKKKGNVAENYFDIMKELKIKTQRRPGKKRFPLNMQKTIRDKAIKKIKSKFLPNKKILKIILIGSSVKNSFGKYDAPGFRGSLYSDLDFIIFTENAYKIPKWLRKEPSGKPFPDNKLNLAYRNKKFIDNKYDLEVFFIRKGTMNNPKVQKLAERAGIPMINKSKNKFIEVYTRQ